MNKSTEENKNCLNIFYRNIKFFNFEVKLWQLLFLLVILLFLYTLLENKSTKKLSNFSSPLINENIEIFMLKGGYFF